MVALPSAMVAHEEEVQHPSDHAIGVDAMGAGHVQFEAPSSYSALRAHCPKPSRSGSYSLGLLLGFARAEGYSLNDAMDKLEQMGAPQVWEVLEEAVLCSITHKIEEATSWKSALAVVQEAVEQLHDYHTHPHFQVDAAEPHVGATNDGIPDALGCAICCEDLMLRPVSLLCGHSFCFECIKEWNQQCKNCPTCRWELDSGASSSLHVNRALQEAIATFYPREILELERRSHQEHNEQVRSMVLEAINSRRVLQLLASPPAREGSSLGSITISSVLENDERLREQVLAVETRERLRRDRMLREESRRRHRAAYCSVNFKSAPSTNQEARVAFSRSSQCGVHAPKHASRSRILGGLWGRKS